MKRRDMVYNSFGGLCAYTGKPLADDWQIDHIIPVSHPVWYQPEEQRKRVWNISYFKHDAENLVPCCRIINHYKRDLDLEGFRKYIMGLHIRLAKLPKKTRVSRTERRKEYLYEVAELFGITTDKPFDGVFYFESL